MNGSRDDVEDALGAGGSNTAGLRRKIISTGRIMVSK